MLYLKNLTKSLEKRLVIMFVLMKEIYFTCFFFCMLHLLLSEKSSLAIHSWRKSVFIRSPSPPSILYFFPKNISDYLYLLTIIIRVVVSVISSQKLKLWMKIASHTWLEIALYETFLSFKTIKSSKSADLVLAMISFYD